VYELAEVRGRLAQRLYERGDGLYELPEALGDVAPVLFNVVGRNFLRAAPPSRVALHPLDYLVVVGGGGSGMFTTSQIGVWLLCAFPPLAVVA
jgi:hypothetical protein